jgi:hypothetical protein
MFVGLNSPPWRKTVIKQSGDTGDPSVLSMVNGILEDSLKFVKQHLGLFRIEVRSGYRKTKDAALYLASGIGLCLPGILLLCLLLVHLLHALASPGATDPSAIPLWACYGIVAALLALPGLLLGYTGVKKFQSFNPLPEERSNGCSKAGIRMVRSRHGCPSNAEGRPGKRR